MISNPLDGLLGGTSGHDGSNMGGCAGTLIANNFILTAAHCLVNMEQWTGAPRACIGVTGPVGDLLDTDRFSFVINEHRIFKDPIGKKSSPNLHGSGRVPRSKPQSANDRYDRKLRR